MRQVGMFAPQRLYPVGDGLPLLGCGRDDPARRAVGGLC
jgi:hypothetical protein